MHMCIKLVLLYPRYTIGVVQKVMCPADEPYWSVNIKKGLINMLQLNLQQFESLSDNDDPRLDINRTPKETTLKPFYRVMEVSCVC